jgi:hypothetical protein
LLSTFSRRGRLPFGAAERRGFDTEGFTHAIGGHEPPGGGQGAPWRHEGPLLLLPSRRFLRNDRARGRSTALSMGLCRACAPSTEAIEGAHGRHERPLLLLPSRRFLRNDRAQGRSTGLSMGLCRACVPSAEKGWQGERPVEEFCSPPVPIEVTASTFLGCG